MRTTSPRFRPVWPRRAAAFALATGLLTGCGILSSPSGGRDPQVATVQNCTSRAEQATLARVQPDTTWNDTWTQYETDGQGWMDGDSVYAYNVPQLGLVWTFADAYLGLHAVGGGPNPRIFHNLIVVDTDNHFRVVLGDDQGKPTPLVGPKTGAIFDLSIGGAVNGSELQVFLIEEKWVGTGTLDFVPAADLLATYSLPSLKLLSVKTLATAPSFVTWGAYVLGSDGWTYIYGSTATGTQKAAYVARTPSTDLTAPWTYWDGSGWTTDSAAAKPIQPNVQTEFSVTTYDGLYLLITSDSSTPFSPEAHVYYGCSPTGPFVGSSQFLLSPDVGQFGVAKWGESDVYVYDAQAQPALGNGNRIVISYARNSYIFKPIDDHPLIYRPTYLDLTINVPKG